MLNKKVGLIALLTSVAASGVWAGTITNYAVGDVLVCFRKGGNDMVVDAGQISTFTSAAPNQRIPITQYTGTQLAQVGTNGVSWSAFTWLSDNTLFVTRPRTSLNSQTTPWPCASSPVQSGTVGRMATIPPGALDELNLLVYPVSTPTAVVEEDNSDGNPNYTDGVSYDDALTGAYGGDFNGTFAGNPENTTLANFTTSGSVVRSDFYQMTPTSGHASGTWLGYFEFVNQRRDDLCGVSEHAAGHCFHHPFGHHDHHQLHGRPLRHLYPSGNQQSDFRDADGQLAGHYHPDEW